MKNIIDYAKECCTQTFEQSPFNEVDALILSQLTYFKWEHLKMDISSTMIPIAKVQTNIIDLIANSRTSKENLQLYFALLESNRFKNMKVGYFEIIFDKEIDTQFAAITFETDDGVYNIAYRGTDDSIVGWKEDFNLSFSIHIFGQRKSLEYFEKMQKLDKSYRIMGHSKGGNLATYSACVASNPTDILHVYNFDGPGFLPGTIDVNRIHLIYSKFIPQESIIGLIMQENDDYTIIHSQKKHIRQHDPFNWSILENIIEREDALEPLAIFIQRSANQWLLHASLEKRQSFFDTIFKLLDEQSVDTLSGFTMQDLWSVLKDFKNDNDENKEIVSDLLKLLISSNVQQSKEMIGEYIDSKRTKE